MSRATKAEMKTRYAAFVRLAAQNAPASVRHLYYRAVVAGVSGITKDDSGYSKAQRAVLALRRLELVPYEWIVDLTRWQRKAASYNSVNDALQATASVYRRNLWMLSAYRVEVWVESDSIAGVAFDVTDRWDVPLMSTRGYSSATFAFSAAEAWRQDGRTPVVLYVGDHDPHGLHIEEALRRELETHYGPGFQFERLAVTWEQVEELDLPGTPPKKSYAFPLAVEAEALSPGFLRDLLNARIEEFVDPDQLAVLRAAEESERDLLMRIAASYGSDS
jgi:hypothetical protein